MTVLVVGAGLVGAQVVRQLVDRGERPVVLEPRPQREALADIVDVRAFDLVEGDVLQPFALSAALAGKPWARSATRIARSNSTSWGSPT